MPLLPKKLAHNLNNQNNLDFIKRKKEYITKAYKSNQIKLVNFNKNYKSWYFDLKCNEQYFNQVVSTRETDWTPTILSWSFSRHWSLSIFPEK